MPPAEGAGHRTAVVAGGGGEIGRAVALRLACDGARVVAVDLDRAAAEATAEAVVAAGGAGVAVEADLTSSEAVDAAFEAAAAEGDVEVVVHAAGVLRTARLMKLDEQEWDEVFDANAKSRFLVSRAGARAMGDHGRGGAIVDVGSITSERVTPGRLHYCVANAVSSSLMDALAEELAPRGIRVFSIESGPVATKMIGYRASDPERLARFLQFIPIGRLGQPDDIADAVAFLAGEETVGMSGARLHLDGGWTAG
ncbi:MAG TPA: SDR family oxidoreductase [Solirubrobacterales bacterium]|jgi:3-oxoacyl-[acyl-carrier protein] reductase